jgi:putative redox protein
VITIVGVSHEKNIPLSAVDVELDYSQNHAISTPADPRQRELKVTRMVRRIRLKGPPDSAAREALLQGAERCPVSRSLEGGIAITTTLL